MGFLLIRPSSTVHLSWRRASLCLSLSTLQFFEVDLLPFLDCLCTFHLCHLHTHSYVVFLHCCLLGSFLCRHCHVLVFEVYGWITDILASGFLWKTVWTRLGILARGPLRNCFMGGASRTSTILLHVLDHHLSSGYILLRSAFCSASCPVVDPRREKFARVLSVVVICGALPPRYGLFGQLGSLWFWWLVVCWLRGYLPSCLFSAVALPTRPSVSVSSGL